MKYELVIDSREELLAFKQRIYPGKKICIDLEKIHGFCIEDVSDVFSVLPLGGEVVFLSIPTSLREKIIEGICIISGGAAFLYDTPFYRFFRMIRVVKIKGKSLSAIGHDICISQYLVDEYRYVDLFFKVFKEKISLEYWRWKYKDSKHNCITLLKNGCLIGFYGSTSRKLLINHHEVESFQSCDVMLDHEVRGKVEGGCFDFMCSEFIHRVKSSQKIAFGFPHKAAFVLGKRLGLYNKHDEIVTVHVKSSFVRYSYSKVDVNESDIERAWAAMSSTKKYCFTVKDSQYLKYRYVDNPGFSYEYFLGVYEGNYFFIVFKNMGNGSFSLMDVVGDLEFYDVFLSIAFSYMKDELGGTNLFMWVRSQLLFLLQGKFEFSVERSGAVIAFNDVGIEAVNDGSDCGFFLFAGDTEFL